MTTLPELVAEYLRHVEANSSPATVAQYGYALRNAFLPWAEAERIRELEELTPAVLDRYSRHLQTRPGAKGQPLSATTVRTYVRNLNLFLAWAHRSGEMSSRLLAVAPRVRHDILQVLTREEVNAIVKAARNPRDELIVRLLADTGMRVGELVNLRCQDVVSQDGKCYLYLRGKTGGRIVGVERPLFRQLRKYIEGGRPGGDAEAAPVFMSARRDKGGEHQPLTESGVGQLIHHLARAAGIQKRVYPHLFRHSYATDFLNNRGDSVMLAKILGHGSLAMIQSVYAHLAADHVHDAMLAYLQTGRKPKGKG